MTAHQTGMLKPGWHVQTAALEHVGRAAFKQLRDLRDMDFPVCPWCFYDLRSLDADGACPECGEPFDPETLGREWRDRLEPSLGG